MTDNPPVICNEEDFFEWKPKMIRHMQNHFPVLLKWLPKLGNGAYPVADAEDPPEDPGDSPPDECIFDAGATDADVRLCQQNMKLYEIQRSRFLEFNNARIKCAKALAASIGGDVKEKLIENDDYIEHEENCDYQAMWVDICEAQRLDGKVLRDKQDQYLAELKNLQQGDDEDVKSFNAKFDRAVRYLGAMNYSLSEVKKADYYLNSLNAKFDGLRMKYLSYEYDEDDDGFKARDVIQEALKWETAMKSRSGLIKTSKTLSTLSNSNEKLGINEKTTFSRTLLGFGTGSQSGNVSATTSNVRNASVSATAMDNNVPTWLTTKLSKEEYNSLTAEQKRVKRVYNIAIKGNKTGKLICNVCQEEGHVYRNCPEVKKIQQSKMEA